MITDVRRSQEDLLTAFVDFLESQGVSTEAKVPHDPITCACEVFPCPDDALNRRPVGRHELEELARRFLLERPR